MNIFLLITAQPIHFDFLRELAKKDKNLKLIVNARNFGHIRSPQHAIYQTSGDACILIHADLQDPPSLITNFIKKFYYIKIKFKK